jgi:ABC-type multidrug transport system fused ATPase/permease subunit
MTTLKFLYINLGKYKLEFALIFIAGAFNGIVHFAIPFTLSSFANSVGQPSQEFVAANVSKYFMYLTLLYVAMLFIELYMRKSSEYLSYKLQNQILFNYYIKYLNTAYTQITRYSTGYFLGLINKLAQNIGTVTFMLVWHFSSGMAATILFFYYTFKTSQSVALINLFIFLIFIYVGYLTSKKIVPLANQQNITNSKIY